MHSFQHANYSGGCVRPYNLIYVYYSPKDLFPLRLRCALRAIVSDIASAALCSATYRCISLTIARNAQRTAAVVETGLKLLQFPETTFNWPISLKLLGLATIRAELFIGAMPFLTLSQRHRGGREGCLPFIVLSIFNQRATTELWSLLSLVCTDITAWRWPMTPIANYSETRIEQSCVEKGVWD